MGDSGLVRELKAALGNDRVITDKVRLLSYAYDSQRERSLPGVVVHIESREQVQAVLRIAVSYGTPVVARGAGSGMTGGSVPEIGGIVLNMERMNRIVRFDTEDRLAYVQPGVVTGDLQALAASHGLFYPPEPASAAFSTLGGNVAESAGGLGCVKYGLTRDFIAGLEFVISGGEVVRTGVYSDRQAPFDLGAVMAGSEGMLGIITEIALRLISFPERRITTRALFSTLPQAAAASNAILMAGVVPAVLEFMDRACIETVREYAGIEVPDGAGAALIVEVDGDSGVVKREQQVVREVLQAMKPVELVTAETPEERTAIWKLRKSLSPAIARIAPVKFNEDICVPVSRIPAMCAYVAELAERRQVTVVTFGHSGDGNIHVNFMTSGNRPDELVRISSALEELFEEAVAMGGTLSGEHGIGIAKRPYLSLALDDPTIEFEKKIKRAFDPAGILNPGKVFSV